MVGGTHVQLDTGVVVREARGDDGDKWKPESEGVVRSRCGENGGRRCIDYEVDVGEAWED